MFVFSVVVVHLALCVSTPPFPTRRASRLRSAMGPPARPTDGRPGADPAPANGDARSWLLLGARAGDRAQVEILGVAVARALGWDWADRQSTRLNSSH